MNSRNANQPGARAMSPDIGLSEAHWLRAGALLGFRLFAEEPEMGFDLTFRNKVPLSVTSGMFREAFTLAGFANQAVQRRDE